MAKTDMVPCYYTGQRVGVDRPVESKPRYELHEAKRQKLGKFVVNGKFFLFFKKMVQQARQLWDGPFGVGNLLPFYKSQNPLMAPNKLHYEIPQANDVGLRRHELRRQTIEGRSLLLRRIIRVSARKIDFAAAAHITNPAQLPVAPSSLMQLA